LFCYPSGIHWDQETKHLLKIQSLKIIENIFEKFFHKTALSFSNNIPFVLVSKKEKQKSKVLSSLLG